MSGIMIKDWLIKDSCLAMWQSDLVPVSDPAILRRQGILARLASNIHPKCSFMATEAELANWGRKRIIMRWVL